MPPPLTFLKVNFDGSTMDGIGRARFMIQDLDSWLIITGGVRLVDTFVSKVELRVVWEGITYVRVIL